MGKFFFTFIPIAAIHFNTSSVRVQFDSYELFLHKYCF